VRLYHFVNEQYGLDDIRQRRLKIATLQDLNDPFELLSIDCSNESIRRAFTVLKDELSKNRGIICFSRKWDNPVLWSHYSDKHRGLCLGFDLPDGQNQVHRISYSRQRLIAELDKLAPSSVEAAIEMKKLLFTKYAHWRYEDEVRGFVTLEEQDSATQLYFVKFSEELKLKEVIVGACSTISRNTLHKALGDLSSSVSAIKARLAFKTFRVVRQRNSRLWE
jgi:hypothetical protein